MQTKLSLRLVEHVIARLKNYTMKNKISLVKFIEIVLRKAPGKSEIKSQNQTPIVNKYKGILKNIDVDEKTELTGIIIKKHS